MSINYINARQKQRIATAAQWQSVNPVLLTGEIGIESDTHLFKVGDGSSVWNNLLYNSVNYENINNKPTIPTKTSELVNDSGFLTAVPKEYVTKSSLNNTLANYVDNTSLSYHLSVYALKTDVPTKTSELTNDSGFMTEFPPMYVNAINANTNNIKKLQSTVNGIPNTYAKKADIPSKTSQLQNDSGFLTSSSLSGYLSAYALKTSNNTFAGNNEFTGLTTLHNTVAASGSTINLSAANIVNVPDPTTNSNAVNKHYLDQQIASIGSVTQNITLKAGGWSNRQYVINNNNIEAASVILFDAPVGATLDEYVTLQNAVIVAASQTNGSITLQCLGVVPTVDVTATIVILK